MELKTKRYTAEEFDEFVALPENIQRNFELIGGEIVEKMPTNGYCSEITLEIVYYFKAFLKQGKVKGRLTGADSGYKIAGERYVPDIAFVSAANQKTLPKRGAFNPKPPDLVVEVVSPTDEQKELSIKISNYLSENIVVWIVYPDDHSVHIHTPCQPVQVLNINDTIDGGAVLPGFTLAVKDIFPEESDVEES